MSGIALLGGVSRVPVEVRGLVSVLGKKKPSADVVRNVLTLVTSHLTDPASLHNTALLSAHKELGIDQDTLVALYAGLRFLVQAMVRVAPKSPQLAADLKTLRIPAEVAADLAKLYTARGEELCDAAREQRLAFPSLGEMRWRVDVAISSGALSRVLRPYVLMQWVLTDGTMHTFEVPVERFKDLRYHVSHLLQEMHTLQQHRLVKS